MEYFTSQQVQDRYKISPTTLWRWVHDEDLRFPTPLVVKRRRLFEQRKILEWERLRSGEVA
ncbi:hypothetical protein PMI07_002388 [Rhizobium sp. CF080]|uniref:helix-turn-helix domain-containing protein n=1 Tax=Rhizobium sp. (strain CF080) TaxID=1144310 RepID=UPI000271C621|nr:hypothetical protein PMI07_002388 [Rhizobium sp. CF080]